MFVSSGVAPPYLPPRPHSVAELPCYKEGQHNLEIVSFSDLAVMLLGFLQCTHKALASFSDIFPMIFPPIVYRCQKDHLGFLFGFVFLF